MTDTPETALRQDFDSPWKEALDVYFPEFLMFFFPEIYAAVDWERGHRFLDKEFQKIVREAEQGRRHVDKLVQVFLINGGETWLLIHVEIQGQAESGFAKRMFVYYYRILDRCEGEVSLGVLADDGEGWRPDRFSYELWGCRVGHSSYPG